MGKTGKTRVLHIRRMELVIDRGRVQGRPAAKGGLTFAIRESQEGYEVAVARCSTEDAYSRRIGRSIALDKLISQQTFDVTKLEGGMYESMFAYVGRKKSLRRNLRTELYRKST